MFTVPDTSPDTGSLRDDVFTFFEQLQTVTDGEPDPSSVGNEIGTSASEPFSSMAGESRMDTDTVLVPQDEQELHSTQV